MARISISIDYPRVKFFTVMPSWELVTPREKPCTVKCGRRLTTFCKENNIYLPPVTGCPKSRPTVIHGGILRGKMENRHHLLKQSQAV